MITPALRVEIEKIAGAEATKVYRTLGTEYGVAETPRHEHGGFDAEYVPYGSLRPFYEHVNYTIFGVEAATTGNYGPFWIAPAACSVSAFSEVHTQAGSDAGAVTVQLEKLTSGVAPDSGTVLLNAALSLKSTANIVQEGVILVGDAKLLAGDRLGLKDAGTLTAVRNVTVLVTIKYQ